MLMFYALHPFIWGAALASVQARGALGDILGAFIIGAMLVLPFWSARFRGRLSHAAAFACGPLLVSAGLFIPMLISVLFPSPKPAPTPIDPTHDVIPQFFSGLDFSDVVVKFVGVALFVYLFFAWILAAALHSREERRRSASVSRKTSPPV
jgi:hypothetical protein